MSVEKDAMDPEEVMGENYRKTIDGSDNQQNKLETGDEEDDDDAAEQQTEDKALDNELNSNFPLSGGGTEPYFTNEEA